MGSPQGLELASRNRDRWTQRKEAEEEAETDAASYSRNWHKRQLVWSQLPAEPVDQQLRDRKDVIRGNMMKIFLALRPVRALYALSQLCFLLLPG